MISLKTKMLVKNLIDQLDMKKCLEHSFKNYHTKGLYYINLFRDEKLTIKLYFMIPGVFKHNSDGYLISPHKHAYNFDTEVLFGNVNHVLFKEMNGGTWSKYLYESYKQPEQRLTFIENVDLSVISYDNYQAGESYYVSTNETHSLVLPEDQMSCLLLHQYANTELNGTDFYSTEKTTPSFENVYEKFTEDEIVHLLKILKNKIRIH